VIDGNTSDTAMASASSSLRDTDVSMLSADFVAAYAPTPGGAIRVVPELMLTPSELLEIQLVQTPIQADTGIVDQPVDPTVSVQRRLNKPPDCLTVGDISGNSQPAVEFLAQALKSIAAPCRKDRVRTRLMQ
jgi:hypothetical protein